MYHALSNALMRPLRQAGDARSHGHGWLVAGRTIPILYNDKSKHDHGGGAGGGGHDARGTERFRVDSIRDARFRFCVMFWYGVGMGFGFRGDVKGSGGCVWDGWLAGLGVF